MVIASPLPLLGRLIGGGPMTYCPSVGSVRVSRRPDLGDGGLYVVQSILQVVILVVYITHLQLPLLNVERVDSSLQVIPGLLH